MQSLNNLQFDLYASMNRSKVNFKKAPKERLTVSYIESRLEGLEHSWKTFCENHTKILTIVTSTELKDTEYYTKNLQETTEEFYIDFKSDLKEALLKFKKPVTGKEVSECHSKSDSLKLAKIQLPVFSGSYSSWISFRDLFTSLVHNNKDLDDVQKLHYLKTNLSGEPEGLLRPIALTSSNYEMCWLKLKNRYDNKRYLCNNILKRFMSQKNVTTESSSALKDLLDTSNECLHDLRNLGINIDNWDVIVIYIVTLKLDNESRKQWEALTSENLDQLPTYKQFEKFLGKRFRSLEFLDHKVQRDTPNRNISVKAHYVSNVNCSYCRDNHKIANCKQFSQLSMEARREFVQTNSLCFNCLGINHSVYSCRQSTRCRFCKKKHHTLLHLKKVFSSADSVEKNVTAVAATLQSEPTINVASCFSNSHNQVLLATALISVGSKNGTSMVLRSLLDQGSQASFITESAVQLLGLKKVPSENSISGLGGDSSASITSRSMVFVNIQSRIDPNFVFTAKAYVLKKLTSLLPEQQVKAQILLTNSSMALADPSFDKPNKIDLLLGAEVYSQILLEGIIKDQSGSLVAQNTKLGWILSGRLININHSESNKTYNVIVSLHTTQISDNELIKRFWELEAEPKNDYGPKQLTPDEQKCEEIFSSSTKRDEFGRYIVRLPFRSNKPSCKDGRSDEIAYKRFLSLERRLMKNPELKLQYSAVIQEYLALNHMEVVEDGDKGKDNAVYLPHHAVVRDDKSTTKVRIVFDASCPGSNGVSLNHDLLVGPQLQPELRHIVMRWRCHPICIVADIVKMYRQVKIADDDKDFQRILWRENPGDVMQHLRHLRVTFGTSSAPYLAVRALQQLSYDEGNEFPLAKGKVLTDFYMDDFMSGGESVDEGVQIYEQMSALLHCGGFQLQKWMSNNEELMKKFKEGNEEQESGIELKTDEVSKILGLTWNKKSDEFEYTVHLPPLESPVTKRKVISDIARLFDPLGWIAPAITTAKTFIQRIWLAGVEWDEELPELLLKDWIEYRNDLCKLTNFRLPRWIHSTSQDKVMELHGFSDASNSAYAAVVYARVVDEHGEIHVNLVTSKSKVAPVKQVSIPRLELCGAVLLAKLLDEVATILKVPKNQIHGWTDSTVVLAWLSSHPSRWKTFIANRVSEILTLMDGSQWSHVPSQENPADCASRGVRPSECDALQLWKKGPSWLREEEIDYKTKKVNDTTLEERKIKQKCHTVIETEDFIISRYSKLSRLIRVIAFCRRFLRMKTPENKRNEISKWLTTKELNEALHTCIRICQYQYFEDEIDAITAKKKLKKNSKLTSLSPFLDDTGILRVGGRLQRAHLNEKTKHPILIPHESGFTNLLIADAHERTLHGGPQLMLNFLRSSYWVINAKSLVRRYVHKCTVCVRHSRQTNQQLMGQLPEARVVPQRPFQCSGVDYAGPISIRTSKGRGHRSTKGYICLFVCMSTRAIHLEVVSDMTAQSFLAAFKRFVARRGRVLDLWSDNGTTFVGSFKELKYLFDVERSSVAPEIVDFLVTNGTNWHFIPPHAPNFGGLWEAGVKSTKHHLKRIIGNSTLTFEEMTTVLCQIESCLNSRPISYISNSVEDPSPLTPGHFLVGEPLVTVPDANYENIFIGNLKRWQLTQRMLQDFWRRWSLEYLCQLQHRYKWSTRITEPSVGSIVLVKEDGLPPGRWLYGIIVKKHPGLDNLTRVVTLRCKNNLIKRPVSKLIILPVTL